MGKKSFRTIAPPDAWKKKIVKGRGRKLETIEARAERALQTLQADFTLHLRQGLEQVDREIVQARGASAAGRAEALSNVRQLAHEIRGQAGTFGYELITTIASSLCGYIDEAPSEEAAQLRVIEIHADAIRAILADDIRGDGGEMGRALLAGMREMVGKMLVATRGQHASAAAPARRASRAGARHRRVLR